jgi:hypothetical protein
VAAFLSCIATVPGSDTGVLAFLLYHKHESRNKRIRQYYRL